MARTIEKLIYTNERGESVEFSTQSIYHTNVSKDATGLSDVRNAIYSFSSMGQDGDTYLGNRIESRDIEIIGSIKERDRDVVHERRRTINRIMNPDYKATLTYVYGNYRRVINVTIDNAPIFERGVIFTQFTIQLRCLNPFWRLESKSRDDIAAWIGAFEFPLPDGLEIPMEEGWIIGYREPSLIVNVRNDGDVKTGLMVEFRAMGEVTNPSILDINTQEYIKMNTQMHAGDVITVNTSYGEKEVLLTRNGIKQDAFRDLDVDSTYLQLAVGDNLFRYAADVNLENLEVTIYHDDLFLGV